jgi:chromosome segregation ATPase
MTKAEKDAPEIVRAAAALEDELVRLETISRSVRKIRLDSEKSISRAAKELNEALEMPERLATGLRALGAAMERMQARQQAALEPLAARAGDVQQRIQRLGEHMQVFAGLGKAAAETTALLQSEDAEPEAMLEQAREELAKIADGARSLIEAARSDDFPDVAREADTLKQRVSALRGRLGGLKENGKHKA